MDVLGEIALVIVGTAVALMCISAVAWSAYDKHWSNDARRRRRVAEMNRQADDYRRKRTVDELVQKCQDKT